MKYVELIDILNILGQSRCDMLL